MTTEVFAPGRVNLIGDHTDYTGGLAMPMAVDLGTTIVGERGGDEVVLRSADLAGEVRVALDVDDPAEVTPAWGRYVAGVVAELRPARGFVGTVSSTLPIGAGLSSSASLEVAVAVALGANRNDPGLAELCQRAEQRASGVPCGIMDQLAIVSGRVGHALRLDCHTLTVTPTPVPEHLGVVVVDSGQSRELAGSAYAERRTQCEAAEAIIGPLRLAEPDWLTLLDDDVLRRRARHVITENQRVRDLDEAFRSGDGVAAGALMTASHESLRDDFDVSTPTLDALVDRLGATDGVFGARLTGAGFGGCVVALVDALVDLGEGWRLRPGGGPTVTERPG